MGNAGCCLEGLAGSRSKSDACPAKKNVTLAVKQEDGSRIVISHLNGKPVSLDWTFDEIQEAIWEGSYHHPRCQRPMYEGKKMMRGDTLQSVTGLSMETLPELIELGLRVKDRFPQKLGPFSIAIADIKGSDFSMQVNGQVQAFNVKKFSQEEKLGDKFSWQMSSDALRSYGMRARGASITSNLSWVSDVTVAGSQRQGLMIPEDAKQFIFSYPIKDVKSLQSVSLKDLAQADAQEKVNNFLSLGGFMYFNEDGNVCGVTTLRIADDDDDTDMHFGKPKKWLREWTSALSQKNSKSFCRVTIGALAEEGVQYFCWLPPGQILKGSDGKPFKSQPSMANGGFVYLFHEDMNSQVTEECSWDCYFPIKTVLKTTRTAPTTFTAPTHEGKEVVVKLAWTGAHSTKRTAEIRSHNGASITVKWTIGDLKDAIWDAAFAHPNCQKIKYAGKELGMKDTIESTGGFGLGEIALELEIDHGAFPQTLGPFSVGSVPLKADFVIKNQDTDWALKTENLLSYGIVADGPTIKGRVSPSQPVTADDMNPLLIPAGAAQSVWAYPSPDWALSQEYEKSANGGSVSERDMLVNFLSVGGFIYGGEDGNVAAVTTLGAGSEKGGLCFGKPKKWCRDWSIALIDARRFQKVTIKALQDVDAHYFCWLPPGDKLLDSEGTPFPNQPQVPLGGFAYLMHKNPRTTKQDKLALDCYFPVKAMRLSERQEAQPEMFQSVSTQFPARRLSSKESAKAPAP